MRKIPWAERKVASLLCKFVHFLMFPLKASGVFGTRANPRFFHAGDAVPFWIETCYPACSMTFLAAAIVYYDWSDGNIAVQANEPMPGGYLIDVEWKGGLISHMLVVGAPTKFLDFDGTRLAEPESCVECTAGSCA